MARLFFWFIGLLVVAAGIAVGAYVWFDREVNAPGPLRTATTIIIPPGSGTPAIARVLSGLGVVRYPLVVELEARRSGKARALKPGEYRFEPGITVTAALDKLVRHDVVARFVTIPEGLTASEAMTILGNAAGMTGEVKDTPEEGAILPETYRYEWGDTRESVVAHMKAARAALLKELWDARAPNLPLDTPEQAVVLASVVEKETGVAAERPRVAAVFVNRLRKGIKLQSDPTVIYGLAPKTGALDRPLTRADLEQATPYNTYVIDGLPPGPICNPGRAAIAAVLSPAASDDLYFVADGSGGHVFATTLDQHNRNVAAWRKLNKH
ncbi:MAG: endolytic transglycosylase MltG [Rhodospirillaceae bacterium]|nr:endolytic transglycosylase MltG [Rhodospirillaceae bacterium]